MSYFKILFHSLSPLRMSTMHGASGQGARAADSGPGSIAQQRSSYPDRSVVMRNS